MQNSFKNSNPPLSVIVPCYNHGQYVRDAIASVEQCDSDLYEIIIVNDGSTDPYTVAVIRELQDEGYHVIDKQNEGLAASRNAAIKVARGRYIVPLDADNKIRPRYIQLGIEVLDQNPGVGVFYGRPELFGEIEARNYPEVESFSLHRLVVENFIDACAVIRKSALFQCGLYDRAMPYSGLEDWDLWLSMAANGWQFSFTDEILFSYRILANSLIDSTRQTDRLEQNIKYLYSKHALLIRRVLNEQLTVMSDHPRAMRYSQLWKERALVRLMNTVLLDSVRSLVRRNSEG